MRCTPALILLAACGGGPASGSAVDAAAPADDAHRDALDHMPPDAPEGAVTPFWSSEMRTAGADFYTRHQPEGSVTVGVADNGAGDGYVARLVFPGIPALGNKDRVSPEFASELATNREDFHYGVYRMRVKLATCGGGEEVVNGLFTYFNDGKDHDGDGLVDNSEIDVEILCGTPSVLFLTVWTQYTFATERFRKVTRAIDLSTGDLWQSPAPDQYGLDKIGNDPALRRPDLLDPSRFLEIGFEWRADRVRYFATIDGDEKTLFDLREAARIPHLPAAIMFNVWHPGEHWFGNGGPPDYPASPATLLVDRIAYWK